MKLSEALLGQKYRVTDITVSEDRRRRIYDIGLTQGAVVEPLFNSFLGRPTAYSIRGAVIVLRRKDSERIFVKRLGGDENAEKRL